MTEQTQENLEGWREGTLDPGRLPVFDSPTREGVESEWASMDQDETFIQWKRGALLDAALREGIYHPFPFVTLAGKWGVSVSTLEDYLWVYRRILKLSDEDQDRAMSLDLLYTHYRHATPIRSDEKFVELLEQASTYKWRPGRFAEAAQKAIAFERQHSSPKLDHPDADPEVTGAGAEIPDDFETRDELEKRAETLAEQVATLSARVDQFEAEREDGPLPDDPLQEDPYGEDGAPIIRCPECGSAIPMTAEARS